MIGKSGEKAGRAKASPALRVSRLRALVARVLERAEAMQQGDTALAEDERVLKLVGLAVKLQGELKALGPAARIKAEPGGARRKADEEALRAELARRLAQLRPGSPGKPALKKRAQAAA